MELTHYQLSITLSEGQDAWWNLLECSAILFRTRYLCTLSLADFASEAQRLVRSPCYAACMLQDLCWFENGPFQYQSSPTGVEARLGVV